MKEIILISKVTSFLVSLSNLYRERMRIASLKKLNIGGYSFACKAEIFYNKNVKIVIGTKIKTSQLYAGINSKILIRNYTAFGYCFPFESFTHDVSELQV